MFRSSHSDGEIPQRLYTAERYSQVNGSVKPEDWLSDYLTAVRIAGGNRRVAVRYAPLMLQGSDQTWLNSLPKDSVNCWEDFTTEFIHNFTSTYERPNLHGS